MNAAPTKEHALKQRTCWLCCFVHAVILSPSDYSLASEPPQHTSQLGAAGLPRETRKFELLREPSEDDTPGALAGGGYLWRDVLVVQRSYRAVGRQVGGATVETIVHSSAYPYVLHDFFGIYGASQLGKSFDNKQVEQRFVTWIMGNANRSETICVTLVPKYTDVFAGNIGWYSRAEEDLTTVVIYFDQLDGVPVQLVDEFLKRHPSSVNEDDFDVEGWLHADVRKWIRLLQLHQGDRGMFQQALGQLAKYDRALFGVDPKRLEASDRAAFDEAIEALNRGAEEWLAKPEAKTRKDGHRGE